MELVSRLDTQRQALSAEIFEYQKCILVELSDQAHNVDAIELQMELQEFWHSVLEGKPLRKTGFA